jgi:hypothetical protein
MAPIMLHSMFDFALHMPANAMWFAALGGVMFNNGAPDPARRKAKIIPP